MEQYNTQQQDVPIRADYITDMTGFLHDWHVRVTWIAFTTLWLLWVTAWVIRHAFGGDSPGGIGNATSDAEAGANPGAANEGGQTGAASKLGILGSGPPAWSEQIYHRVNRAHNVLRDLTLMLLSVLTINTFARAATRAVMIVAWLFVAFAVVWMFVEGIITHRYIRFVYTTIFLTLGLIIIGFAWKQGFY